MIGFGNLSTGGAEAEELRRVELAFVPRSTCDNDYNGAITNVMMCATDPGQDSCQGDSGEFFQIGRYQPVNKALNKKIIYLY